MSEVAAFLQDPARIKAACKLYVFIGMLTATMALMETSSPFLLAMFVARPDRACAHAARRTLPDAHVQLFQTTF